MKHKEIYQGTGFCVLHKEKSWLLTCRHNVEARTSNFLGCNDLEFLTLGGVQEIAVGDGRSVVGISVDGFIADCVAIELRAHEWRDVPKFDSAVAIWVKGETLPTTISFRAPPPRTDVVDLKATGWAIFQGFPGESNEPLTLRAARIVQLPSVVTRWMISCVPAPQPGFSGGPLLDITNDRLRLLGITTHRFNASFEATLSDGRRAEIKLPAYGGVPIAPLLWALSQNSSGLAIVPVSLPIHMQGL